MIKKASLLLPLLLIPLLLKYCLHTPLPSLTSPVQFYSNQSRQDLKLLLCKLLKEAKESIHIATYHLTDKDIIGHLNAQAQKGVAISIVVDKSNKTLPKKLEPSIDLHLIKSRGLMHEKLLIIDQKISFLGSANLTHDSLAYHENILMGIYHFDLADQLCSHLANLKMGIHSEPIEISIEKQKFSLYFFPESGSAGLNTLSQHLEASEQTLFLSMFTLTHPTLVNNLLAAQKRHPNCHVIIDRHTAQGASKKAHQTLLINGLAARTSRSLALFHHKWALIDEKTLVLGSANWTKGAFEKNSDYMLFYSPLSSTDRDYFKSLSKRILAQSN